jgi:hypothetical protein
MRRQPDNVPVLGPQGVKTELLLFACLACYLDADLTRTWLGTLYASDASPSYGFGVSAAEVPAGKIRALALHAQRSSCHVRLLGGEAVEVLRLGEAYRIPVPMSAFRTLLSSKAQYSAHSGALEAAGVTLMLRCVTRSATRHSSRVCCLIDAQAVLGAVIKGRSSSGTLGREVARIGAICTAANLLPRYVYVPSESNPADAPSRGVV